MESEERSHQQIEIDLHKRLAKEYRRRYSPEYSKIFQRYWNRAILNELEGNGQRVVLDFGCGTGTMTKDLSDRYASTFGVDISLEMIKQAYEDSGVGLKRLIVGDGLKLPFSSGAFDTVVCRGALHHLPSLDDTLDEICRVLSPEGILVLSEPSNDSFIIRTARRIMYEKSDKFHDRDKGYISEEIIGCLIRHKFRIERTERFGFLSYLFAGFPDHFCPLDKIPFNRAVTRLLIAIDKILSKTPLIKMQSLHIIIKAKKL